MDVIYSKHIPAAGPLKNLQSSASIEYMQVRDSNAIVPEWISMVLPVKQSAAPIAFKVNARIYVM